MISVQFYSIQVLLEQLCNMYKTKNPTNLMKLNNKKNMHIKALCDTCDVNEDSTIDDLIESVEIKFGPLFTPSH
jgi:enoyl-[acyl-carrier-protein] reductase (NADH)